MLFGRCNLQIPIALKKAIRPCSSNFRMKIIFLACFLCYFFFFIIVFFISCYYNNIYVYFLFAWSSYLEIVFGFRRKSYWVVCYVNMWWSARCTIYLIPEVVPLRKCTNWSRSIVMEKLLRPHNGDSQEHDFGIGLCNV